MNAFNNTYRKYKIKIAKLASSVIEIIPDGVVSSEEEKQIYFERAFERFAITLALLPIKKKAVVLDVGISPYFLALFIKKIFKYKIVGINAPQSGWPTKSRGLITKNKKIKGLPEYQLNIERDKLPFTDRYFDIVLCGEIIEHLLQDPIFMLKEIRRVLKKNGVVILSTPNVVSLYNRCRLLLGHNIYSDYSPYGPYGKHNREFTAQELSDMFTKAGFTIGKLMLNNKSSQAMRLGYAKNAFIVYIYNLLTHYFHNFRENIFIVAYPDK